MKIVDPYQDPDLDPDWRFDPAMAAFAGAAGLVLFAIALLAALGLVGFLLFRLAQFL
jgi:hypothetical protein